MADATIRSVDTDAVEKVTPWDWFSYGIVESPSRVRLAAASELAREAPIDYSAGLLFGPEAELRWRRLRGGTIRVVCVDDRARDLEGWRKPGELVRLDDGQMVLWGEPQGGAKRPEWYEPRVPRRIDEYPAKFEGRWVHVKIRRYRMEGAGEEPARYLYRCMELFGEGEGGAG